VKWYKEIPSRSYFSTAEATSALQQEPLRKSHQVDSTPMNNFLHFLYAARVTRCRNEIPIYLMIALYFDYFFVFFEMNDFFTVNE